MTQNRLLALDVSLFLVIILAYVQAHSFHLGPSQFNVFHIPDLPIFTESRAGSYYVSPAGDDNNPGTIDEPWNTPFKAGSTAVAGDTVVFRGGTYHGSLQPRNSGNQTDGWITFKAYPGEEPIIIDDATYSRGVNIDSVNYIAVDGLTAIAAGPNGVGIRISNAHHVNILNNTVRDSATSGIATTYGIDYLTIEGNRVYGNSEIGQYIGSAINIWYSGGPIFDDAPGYHIIIRNNTVYDNRNLISNPTDGNGIILDNNDRGGTPDQQSPKALIANNVVFNNGGRCIHLLNTSNADIINNTCYHNVETQQISNGCGGEINLQRTYSYTSAINIKVFNNVVYGKGGTCNNGSSQAYVFQVFCSSYGCPQYTSDYNLWFNGAVKSLGPHDIVADPEFENASLDPASADFRLKSTSPAIDSGTGQFAQAVPSDFTGTTRPQGDGVDRGAYEQVVTSSTPTPTETPVPPTATPLPPTATPTTPAAGPVTQEISLAAGWNMISSYVEPEDPALATLLASIESDMVLLKNGTGQSYWPELGINSIGEWEVRDGYKIYMDNPATLSITGQLVDPLTTPIDLPAGWSMVAYLRSGPMPVEEALATVAGQLYLIKNNAGETYWPDFGTNQIGDMQPGESYQVYLDSAATLRYPAN